jgi:hypothetical protein
MKGKIMAKKEENMDYENTDIVIERSRKRSLSPDAELVAERLERATGLSRTDIYSLALLSLDKMPLEFLQEQFLSFIQSNLANVFGNGEG